MILFITTTLPNSILSKVIASGNTPVITIKPTAGGYELCMNVFTSGNGETEDQATVALKKFN